MQDIFWNQTLKNEAIRIAKKNNEEFDENDKKNQLIIELMMEDLNDKYRYE